MVYIVLGPRTGVPEWWPNLGLRAMAHLRSHRHPRWLLQVSSRENMQLKQYTTRNRALCHTW